MSIRTRRFVFYSLVIIFLVSGPFIIAYSRGLRFDLGTFSFAETGGIYLVTTPTKTTITLNDHGVKDESSIFQRGTLVTNLTPDTYSLNIAKDGFYPWHKEVPVDSGAVAVFDSVILLPQGEPTTVTALTGQHFVAAGNHTAVEVGGGVNLDGNLVYGHQIITLTPDGVLLTRSTETNNYYINNAATPDEVLNLTLTFNNLKETRLDLPGAVDLVSALPYPYSSDRFVVSTAKAIYTIDTKRLTIEQLTDKASEFYIVDTNSVVWAEGDKLVFYNLPLRTQSTPVNLAGADFDAAHITKLDSLSGNHWLALTTNGDLYLWDQEWQKLTGGITDFLISPSRDSVALTGINNSLAIYDLETGLLPLKDFVAPITRLVWFRSGSHLLALAEGKLYFLEADDSKPLYVVSIAENVTDFSYEAGADDVVFTVNGILYQAPIVN